MLTNLDNHSDVSSPSLSILADESQLAKREREWTDRKERERVGAHSQQEVRQKRRSKVVPIVEGLMKKERKKVDRRFFPFLLPIVS